MVERYQSKTTRGGDYFPARNADIFFVHSGCTLLDCVISGGGHEAGGWPLGRISNIVGDKSTGKTLLAIEACANFIRAYPKGQIWYREAEAAFDEDYAQELGLPVENVDFGNEGIGTQWDTIEAIFEDLDECLKDAEKTGEPGLYIIDSLDALSSKDEMKRDLEEGSYRLEKQKKLGELFRRLVRKVKRTRVGIIIISQVRDKIGVTFGKKHTRSGGRALDFYASVVIWLTHMKRVTRDVNKVKRTVAIEVLAQCEKNKIAMPFRDCEFTLRFGYGIDNISACVNWLDDVGKLEAIDLNTSKKAAFIRGLDKLSDEDYQAENDRIAKAVNQMWEEIEEGFRPKRRKYG